MRAQAQSERRVLLIEPEDGLREVRARALLRWGYEVSATADAEAAPPAFPPRLYDVVVVSADGSCPLPPHWNEIRRRNGNRPLLVVLAREPFRVMAAVAPAIVIADESEQAIEDKLRAFLVAANTRQSA